MEVKENDCGTRVCEKKGQEFTDELPLKMSCYVSD